jgi:hypothetical protein
MPVADGGFVQRYNAQAVVAAESFPVIALEALLGCGRGSVEYDGPTEAERVATIKMTTSGSNLGANAGAFFGRGGLLGSLCLTTGAAAYALVQVKANRGRMAGAFCAGGSVDTLLWARRSRQGRFGTIERCRQKCCDGFPGSRAEEPHRWCRRFLRHMCEHQPGTYAVGADLSGPRTAESILK